jgi:hypothetical protein
MSRRRCALVIGIAGLLLLVRATLPQVEQPSGEAGLAVVELHEKPPIWVQVVNQVRRWLGG